MKTTNILIAAVLLVVIGVAAASFVTVSEDGAISLGGQSELEQAEENLGDAAEDAGDAAEDASEAADSATDEVEDATD